MANATTMEMRVEQIEQEANEFEIKLVGDRTPLKREAICYFLVLPGHPYTVGDRCTVTIQKQ